MPVLLEYKCPCCGGAITFDSDVQKMKCPYCDTEFDVETLESYDEQLKNEPEEDLHWESFSTSLWPEEEAYGLRSYICQTCGGQILTEDTTVATSCPYCGNSVVMAVQLTGALRPDQVIPFQINKEDAKQALLNHFKGKRLLPKAFKDKHLLREIKGIYVPFWLFDTDADADLRCRATRIHTWSDANYIYTRTSHYLVGRSGSLGFEKVPVDGSSRMNDTLMESLEPFDFSQAVDFRTAYLAGFFADRYDVDAESCAPRANQRIQTSTEAAMAATVLGYHSVVPIHTAVRLKHGKTAYALLPVWLLNTTWEGKKYTFAMNGQTGKLVGDLPLDKKAYWKWLLGLTGILSAVALAIFYLVWLL